MLQMFDYVLFIICFSKQVNSVAVTMDGFLLLSGSEDQTARVWHIHSRQCLQVLNHRGIKRLCAG